MCLLITQSEQSPKLSNAWLEDFYDYNGDGVGVMFVENGSLIIEKRPCPLKRGFGLSILSCPDGLGQTLNDENPRPTMSFSFFLSLWRVRG